MTPQCTWNKAVDTKNISCHISYVVRLIITISIIIQNSWKLTIRWHGSALFISINKINILKIFYVNPVQCKNVEINE